MLGSETNPDRRAKATQAELTTPLGQITVPEQPSIRDELSTNRNGIENLYQKVDTLDMKIESLRVLLDRVIADIG